MVSPCKAFSFQLAASAMDGQMAIGQARTASSIALGSAGASCSMAGLLSMEAQLCAPFGVNCFDMNQST
jgi:hypothetical protein